MSRPISLSISTWVISLEAVTGILNANAASAVSVTVLLSQAVSSPGVSPQGGQQNLKVRLCLSPAASLGPCEAGLQHTPKGTEHFINKY